jgi:polar amino acid transport system permease protein
MTTLVEPDPPPIEEPSEFDSPEQNAGRARAAVVAAVVSCVVPIVIPAVVAFWLARRAERRSHPADRGPIEGRIETARTVATVGFFLGVAVLGALAVLASRDGLEKVRVVFFNWEFLEDSFPTVLEGFWINIQLFVVAEIIVLPWAMVVAICRNLPGRLAAPLRFLSVVYVDVFRGLPAIVTIYLVGFGLPIAGGDWPILGNLTVFQRGVLALVLVYGAYVAEVYRAGIESIHWSQVAAARSLGLSYAKTQRYVVIPQAIRRVVPPLLNDFIGLQKDTALVSTIGVLEALNRAKIYASNRANLSSVVGVGICFLVITVPMTRFTDYLVRRDQRRTQASD